ncbi:hypothetical protein [Fodinibius halophilus]|uniref:Uncharacterized protein n=1 Tax=Fodinibius halophilus TaxID=1736908 RepID=A0A6M1T8D2_9BACT|nr:hypothetical protein [Fodinibius halophilus]NGP89705.1 hypothetical protein [Fodinibius halophilus]
MSDSNIEIDESQLVSPPTFIQRVKHTVYAIILGAVLVQMVSFYGAAKSGTFVPGSIVIHFDNFYFWGYLAICGVLGWIAGQNFLEWLKVKMEFWKFW